MRVAGLLVLATFSPIWAHASVVVNEVAWMGTAASANAEWMELYNSDTTAVDLTNWHLTSGTGSPAITLAGTLSGKGYFLLERTSDASVPTVTADQIYTGALTNSGTTLTLTDANGTTIDQVTGGANWANIGGDNVSKETAQRTSSGWETAGATPRAKNVGVSETTSTSAQNQSSTLATSTPAIETARGNSPPEYIPLPVLRITAGEDRMVSSGADTAFAAVVYDGKGNRRDDAFVTWSFGDGMQRIGSNLFHAYYAPGEYIAVVHALTPDGGDASVRVIVTVEDADVRIVSVSPQGVRISNNSPRTLSLSLWRLLAAGKEFKIPEDTQILPNHTILFHSRVIELPLADSVSLLYPSGEIAATYPALAGAAVRVETDSSPLPEQPSQASRSYKKVSEVEPMPSEKPEVQLHEEAVSAPAAATELAAAGAALPASSTPARAGIFASPWTMGFLGILTLAGSAFIFL